MSLVNLAHVCSHLQNASRARLSLTSIQLTKLHLALALALQKQGFISTVQVGGKDPPTPIPDTILPQDAETLSYEDYQRVVDLFSRADPEVRQKLPWIWEASSAAKAFKLQRDAEELKRSLQSAEDYASFDSPVGQGTSVGHVASKQAPTDIAASTWTLIQQSQRRARTSSRRTGFDLRVGETIKEMQVPAGFAIQLLESKTIRQIQRRSDCYIWVDEEDNEGMRTLHIIATSPTAQEKAESLINGVTWRQIRRKEADAANGYLSEKAGQTGPALTPIGENAMLPQDGEQSREYEILDRFVDTVVGHDGATINEIQERSGCRIGGLDLEGSREGKRPLEIVGSPDAIRTAEAYIRAFIGTELVSTNILNPAALETTPERITSEEVSQRPLSIQEYTQRPWLWLYRNNFPTPLSDYLSNPSLFLSHPTQSLISFEQWSLMPNSLPHGYQSQSSEILASEPWRCYPDPHPYFAAAPGSLDPWINVPRNPAQRRLWLGLKYWQNEPVINKMQLVAKPTRRMVLDRQEIGKVSRGNQGRSAEGILVKGLTKIGECLFVSTKNKGLLESREAVERGLGGMPLVRVW